MLFFDDFLCRERRTKEEIFDIKLEPSTHSILRHL